MAEAYAVLGQLNPSATTATTLYTVPADTSAIISSITIAHLGTGEDTYRIAIRPAGEALANKHYIAYDVTLYEHTAQTLTLGLTLEATDVVTVYASSTDLAFNIFGVEIA